LKLRASERKRSGKWEIIRMESHTCTSSALSQDHRKLNSSFICESIKSLVEKDPSVKVKVIIAHIRERFNYTTTYKKAWIAKNKAIEQIYGNWEKSYQELPRWLIALQTFLPNTVIQLETLQAVDSNGNILQNSGIFHRLFWACYPCIKGFAYCKPIVQVDGT
jgi:proline dehydrogenase